MRCDKEILTDVDPPLEEYSEAEVMLPMEAPHQGEELGACISAPVIPESSTSETESKSSGEVSPRSPPRVVIEPKSVLGDESPEEVVGPRRSTRVTKRPERFSDYI